MFSNYQVIATSYANLSLSVHDRINDLYRRAEKMARAVAFSAGDSLCTDTRPTDGARKIKAWDMIAEALAWNAVSDDPSALALCEKYEVQRMPYRIKYESANDFALEIVPIIPDPDAVYASQQAAIANGAFDTSADKTKAAQKTHAQTVCSGLTADERATLRLALGDRINHLDALGILPDDELVTACKTLREALYG